MRFTPGIVLFALASSLPCAAGSATKGKAVAEEKPAELGTASNATNALGVNLIRKLDARGSNAVFSPYSIQSALAMTYAGSAGETRAEMAKVLHYTDDEPKVHASFRALTQALEAIQGRSKERLQPAAGKAGTGDPITLAVANRLYGQETYVFRRPFLSLLKDFYRAPLVEVDFIGHFASVRLEINAWVAKRTHGRIPEIIPEDAVGDAIRLVLVNAVYLKAPWARPFLKGATSPRPFFLGGKNRVDVPTMYVQAVLGFQARDGFSVVTIPYSDPDIQFLVLLPDKGKNLASLESTLTPEVLQGLAGTPATEIRLFLPKFKLQPKDFKLQDLLRKLGMRTAFSDMADFGRMTADDPIKISEVFHQAYLSIDEDGSEAAAVTAAMMTLIISDYEEPPPLPPEVHVDRPFLFAIQHRPSGACLFLGRMTDPR